MGCSIKIYDYNMPSGNFMLCELDTHYVWYVNHHVYHLTILHSYEIVGDPINKLLSWDTYFETTLCACLYIYTHVYTYIHIDYVLSIV